MTKTAKELINRFEKNNFQPITIKMNNTGETLELKTEKIDKQLVITVNDTITGGLEAVASYLRTYRTNDMDIFAEYESEAKNPTELINHLLINLEEIEPSDSEGWNLEGCAIYNGECYPIELFGHSKEPYIIQAAKDVFDQI